jgi:protein-disulfide isomerase
MRTVEIVEEQPRGDAALTAIAQRLDLNADAFSACLQDTTGTAEALVAANTVEAERLQLRAAPTFYVNGQKLDGHPTIDDFRDALTTAIP